MGALVDVPLHQLVSNHARRAGTGTTSRRPSRRLSTADCAVRGRTSEPEELSRLLDCDDRTTGALIELE
jgi:hypothetical protein